MVIVLPAIIRPPAEHANCVRSGIKKRTPTQATGLCHNTARASRRGRGRGARRVKCMQPPSPHALSLSLAPCWLWLRFCIDSPTENCSPFFSIFLLEFFVWQPFFHIIKADYLGRAHCAASCSLCPCMSGNAPDNGRPPLHRSAPLSHAFMMCGCLVNPVPIMRMWVLRIPNGHFPFRPLLPQASSPHTHTHMHTHRHTHT